MILAVLTVLLLALAGALAPGRASAQVPDEDAPAGPVIEGADSDREVERATDVVGESDAHKVGVWTDPVEWPLSAIHAIVLPDGKVLTYGTDGAGQELNAFSYDIWDPAKGLTPDSHTTLPVETSTNLFCSAQTVLPWSGQVMITGGDQNGFPGATQFNSVTDVNLFDPSSRTVSRLADSTSRGRWYPTVTTLPSGEILLHGGRLQRSPSTPVLLPEVYHPTNGWRQLTNAESSDVYGSGRWWYPRSWVRPDGNVFILSKGSQAMWSLDTDGAGSLTNLGTYPGKSTSNATPAAMFDIGKILMTTEGGTASVIDVNRRTPTVTPTASLSSYRGWSDATVLADGQVLVTGGASKRQQLDHAVYTAELWNPDTGKWRTGASASKARLYHSSAVLLPDATVLTSGGGPPGPVVNLNAEIYHPPYLYKKDGSGEFADRPTIADLGKVGYGGAFPVDVGAGQKISKVALVRTGSVTHSFDMDQRFMELDFTQSGSRLTVSGPRNANVAPPGPYMLFVIDEHGVPSVGELFRMTVAPPAAAAVQTGNLTIANTDVGGEWITATFKRPFARRPVVTVGAVSRNGGDPAMVRVRNVTKTGFQLKLTEWDYDDGEHMRESLTYLAAEPGRHRLGDVTIEAGAVTANDDLRSVAYAKTFASAPIVLSQVASDFDPTTVVTRLANAGTTGFKVRLQEQEAAVKAGQRHGEETVHYIALSTGLGELDGQRLKVRRMGVITSHKWRRILFRSAYADPGLIVAEQTSKGADPVVPRYRRLTTTTAEVQVQEEKSHDSEVTHAKERLGWVVIGAR
ncbi:MAG: DUF1929 domain-containing protein [Actinobacteria bacterium]|nr:DUF1929 domain-containing protein [Actinomycetota bacterium]